MIMMLKSESGKRLEGHLGIRIGKGIVESNQLVCSPQKNLLEVSNIGIFHGIAQEYGITNLSMKGDSFKIGIPGANIIDYWTVLIDKEYLKAFLSKYGGQYKFE